jgi:hypothetical protein
VSQSRTRALFEPLVGCMDELLSCELPALFPEVRTDLGTDADGFTIDSGGALVAEVGPAASTADVARMLLGTWLDHGLFAYETGRLPAVTDDGMERATDLEGTALRELLTRAGRAMDTSAPRRSLDGDLERLRPYRRRTAAELREMASVPSVTAKNRAAFLAMADARDRGLTPGQTSNAVLTALRAELARPDQVFHALMVQWLTTVVPERLPGDGRAREVVRRIREDGERGTRWEPFWSRAAFAKLRPELEAYLTRYGC